MLDIGTTPNLIREKSSFEQTGIVTILRLKLSPSYASLYIITVQNTMTPIDIHGYHLLEVEVDCNLIYQASFFILLLDFLFLQIEHATLF